MSWTKINLSDAELAELNQAEKHLKNPIHLKRIHCIKLKNEGWRNIKLAEFLGLSLNTITNWLKIYKRNGLTGILEWNYKGKSSTFTEEHRKKIEARHKKKPFNAAKEVKVFLKDECCLDFHLHWIQKLLKKNFNFRTKRPNSSRVKVQMKLSKESS